MNELIKFILNGKSVQLNTDGDRKLLWVLRTDLNLTGTKYGCGEGLCGSCTVLLDNAAVRSCQIPVRSVNGKKILTIEGLAKGNILHPLQKAFMDHDALQCGYCTSGMIMEAYSFLQGNPNPSNPEIIKNMNDHFCRCGTYNRIIDAIQSTAKEMRGMEK